MVKNFLILIMMGAMLVEYKVDYTPIIESSLTPYLKKYDKQVLLKRIKAISVEMREIDYLSNVDGFCIYDVTEKTAPIIKVNKPNWEKLSEDNRQDVMNKLLDSCLLYKASKSV